MKFEEELFIGYKLNKNKLLELDFHLNNNYYERSFPLEVEGFHVNIKIAEQDIIGHIFDETFGDEYVLFRNEKTNGEYVGLIREAYKKVLIDIRNKCYTKVMFLDEQSTRIAQYIIKTYGDQPEFPWKIFPRYAVFRNRNNHRWYAIIMDVKDNTLGEGISSRSIINIKPYQEQYQSLIEKENIFPGWHMDKKSWVSVSLSDYFSDDYIQSLIDISYQKVNGKK